VDSLINAAARALAVGDVLGALNRVALREDPPALALRGIAMAQLGDYARARQLLRAAARAFGPQEAMARARCIVAEAEVALAQRDFDSHPASLQSTTEVLEAHGDAGNAAQARLIAIRRHVALGRLGLAADALAALTLPDDAPQALRAIAALAGAEVALRTLRIEDARTALVSAADAAARSGVSALQAEVEAARAALVQPAARVWRDRAWPALRLDEVATLYASGELVVDACRHEVRRGHWLLPLKRRPVLFGLTMALAEAAPGDVPRDTLIAHVFRQRVADDSHRARLRVELGRLRRALREVAVIEATATGYMLRPTRLTTSRLPGDSSAPDGGHVHVLRPPVDGDEADVLALLADGAAWSTSALALALGDSQRTVQRALATLEAGGRVRAIGKARARRWLAAPIVGHTTLLLLPSVSLAG